MLVSFAVVLFKAMITLPGLHHGIVILPVFLRKALGCRKAEKEKRETSILKVIRGSDLHHLIITCLGAFRTSIANAVVDQVPTSFHLVDLFNKRMQSLFSIPCPMES